MSDLLMLCKAIYDAGWQSCLTVDTALKTIDKLAVHEESVARTLGMMAKTQSSTGQGKTWTVTHFVKAVSLKNDALQWELVIKYLDYPDFVVCDAAGLKLILDAWAVAEENKQFPVYLLFQPWTNSRGQLSILYHMVYSNADLLLTVMQILSTTTTRVIRDSDIQSLHVSVRTEAARLANQPLNYLEVIITFIHLSETMVADDIRILMDRLSIQAPELLLLGLAQIQPLRNQLHRDTLLKLLNIFLIGHANSTLVIMLLWKLCPNLLMDGFLALYKKDPASVCRILDVSQEAKILVHVLKMDVPYFVLDLASLAARRQHLNLEKWLLEGIAHDSNGFAAGCIDFLEKKYMMEIARQSGAHVLSTLHLSVDVIGIFLRVLSERVKQPVQNAKITQLLQAYSKIYPQLNDKGATTSRPDITGSSEGSITNTSTSTFNTGSSNSSTNGDIESDRTYAPEFEDTVRRYFERLYTKETSPSRFVSLLKTCRNSSDQKQLDFFNCTIHTLLDEARFFDQYPDDELVVTGELLGLLVEHHLISYSQLRITLKYILDAVSHKVDSKIFSFGIQALLQFPDRYQEWPQYTLLLSKVAGLKKFPVIQDSIVSALQQIGQREKDQTILKGSSFNDINNGISSNTANSSAILVNQDGLVNTANGHDLAPDVSSLLGKSEPSTEHEQPPTTVQERVSFLINNLSIGNMDIKCPELLNLLKASTWPWFSHYLVVRRVSIEPNNHDLYVALLDELDLPQLNDMVVEETLCNIRVLLQSENIATSLAERKLLKHLGVWLGKITIAKNKPIRHKDLSFKDLLLDAYDKDRLVVAIPLCCQVLRQASTSKVFRPPNPWLMSILKLLAELYWTENLRLNLKFEIEILFDTLKLDLNEIEPTSLLEKRAQSRQEQRLQTEREQREQKMLLEQQQKQQERQHQQQILQHQEIYQLDQQQHRQQHYPPEPHVSELQSPNGIPPALRVNASPPKPGQGYQWSSGTSSNLLDDVPDMDLAPLLSRLQFNPAISQFIAQQPLVKVTVFRAVSDAFTDVVLPAILTSSNIAAVSTKELVLKDFASEPDELKLKRAAYAMVQPLAGNLAVATCKEPLCNATVTGIRDRLSQAGLPELLSDEIATVVVSDNLQLMCLFVEQLAHLRGIADIDRLLSLAYTNRISQREQPGGTFLDPLSRKCAPRFLSLPEALKPSGPVSADQLFVYESFNHPPYHSLQQPPVAPPPGSITGSPRVLPPPTPGQDVATSANTLAVKLEQMLLEMDRMIRQTNVSSVSSLASNHDLFLLIRQIPLMISQSAAPLASVMNFVEKVVCMLYESTTRFGREIYVVFLQTLFDISHEVSHETLAWFLYADDHRKFNPEVIATLVQYDVIPAEEYDTYLAKLIYNEVSDATEFAIEFMQQCLLGENPVTFLEDHVLTIIALREYTKDESSTSVSRFMNNLHQKVKPPYAEIDEDVTRCLDARLMLAEWIRLEQHPLATNDICQSLVRKAAKLTQDSGKLCFFARLCTEVCVDHYMSLQSSSPGHQRRAVNMIDAYAKLVSCIANLKTKSDHGNKLEVFGKAFSVIVLVVAHHHERLGSEFNQKPFLRLLTSLYTEIYNIMDLNLLITFSDTLLTLQPINFPGFAFAWLHLVSHRNYLPQLLVSDDSKGWVICQRLVMGLLNFLGPLLEQRQLDTATKTFYRGTLRVLVVLLHDFPEFLCHHYVAFSQAIPTSSIQMRNLILSAFPRAMHLPDPFTPNLQLDDWSNIRPSLDTSYVNVLTKSGLVSAVDDFIQDHGDKNGNYMNNDDFTDLMNKLLTEINEFFGKGQSIGLQFLGSLVLYIGDKSSIHAFSENSFALMTYQYLSTHLSDEGCYLLYGCLADHLRYPNSHTYFFSQALLRLFHKENENTKERITRVLLERLIVNRPHPWGLLSLFIDLMKNDDFWQHDFIQCSPEIEQLFNNVSRSIKHTS